MDVAFFINKDRSRLRVKPCVLLLNRSELLSTITDDSSHELAGKGKKPAKARTKVLFDPKRVRSVVVHGASWRPPDKSPDLARISDDPDDLLPCTVLRQRGEGLAFEAYFETQLAPTEI